MRVCDNCMGTPVAATTVLGKGDSPYDLCSVCRDLLLNRKIHEFAAKHRSFPKPEPLEPLRCYRPDCSNYAEGDMAQYQAAACESHQVDDDGVLVADCYCSQGGGDNMDVDICHHHMKVWS